jgi:membrane-bound metal-dependent hydrolase YbcI (DUF457 family)
VYTPLPPTFMDPITHGIAGSLLGKAYFSKPSKPEGRVAVFAATLGAVFPDVDIFAESFSSDPLAIVKIHRGITHSFVGLPFFAFALACLTRGIARRRGFATPSLPLLTLIYGIGIASHILLDGMTSFGTRMWTPLSQRRVAWDLLFIIDFSFSAIILLPQILAWVYRDREASRGRAQRMWALFSLAAVIVWGVARFAGYPFHFWIVFLVAVLLAVLFFAPAIGAWGFAVSRPAWCAAGVYAMVAYLVVCGLLHHVASSRAKEFALANHLTVERIGALPVPPSFLDWGDAIRTPDGVYEAQFDLRNSRPTVFEYLPYSPPNQYIVRALQLPEVRTYWNFVRFPSVHSSKDENYEIVDFGEHRFSNGGRRAPQPFSYRVVFDESGNVAEEGFWPNGMFLQNLTKMRPVNVPPKANSSQPGGTNP